MNPGNRRVVADHYEIDLDHLLGKGGMSLVYLGRDLRSRRLVAIKTLRPEYRQDPASRSRFRREIRTMAFVQHPAVATVYDYWEDDAAPWAVLEYIQGRSLQDEIDRSGPLDLDLIAHYLNQIADALTSLHERGLVHLDVKPQNLLFVDEHTLKLIDFGLAQPADEAQHLIGGTAFGTAAYLSPEQSSGDPVGQYSDVYAVGCLLYEMLTGKPPFGRATAETGPQVVIRAHLQQPVVPPSKAVVDRTIPGWADEIVMWSLDKHPAVRIESVDLLASLFQSGVDGELSQAKTREIRRSYLPPIELIPESPSSARLTSGGATISGNPVRPVRQARTGRIWVGAALGMMAVLAIAAAMFLATGSIPGLIPQVHPYAAGNNATVVVDNLNFRDQPGLSSATIVQLPAGTVVTIEGEKTTADGENWFPASLKSGDVVTIGYVWQDGIEPDSDSGWAWLRDKTG